MKTLLLDIDAWDLVLDVKGNIAAATEPYQYAQDAASAIRTWLGEAWYDTTIGINYAGLFLGKSPNIALMKSKMVGQALLVPGVVSANVFITSIVGRKVSGQIQVTSEDGQTTAANF